MQNCLDDCVETDEACYGDCKAGYHACLDAYGDEDRYCDWIRDTCEEVCEEIDDACETLYG